MMCDINPLPTERLSNGLSLEASPAEQSSRHISVKKKPQPAKAQAEEAKRSQGNQANHTKRRRHKKTHNCMNSLTQWHCKNHVEAKQKRTMHTDKEFESIRRSSTFFLPTKARPKTQRRKLNAERTKHPRRKPNISPRDENTPEKKAERNRLLREQRAKRTPEERAEDVGTRVVTW